MANFENIIAALYEIRIKTENDKLNEIQFTEEKPISSLELALAHNLYVSKKPHKTFLLTKPTWKDRVSEFLFETSIS